MTTLADIRLKVRRITKSPSANQISDAEIDNYVNTFYLYDLPEHLRLLNLKETYSFITQPNIDIYNFTPNTFVNIEGPVYIGGYQIQLCQDRQQFFNIYPEIQRTQTLAVGTAVIGAGPYAGTITGVPVKRNRVLISTVDNAGNALSAVDTVAGTFAGNVLAGSTINYVTGAIAAVTWTAVIAAGTNILVQSVNYAAARPQAILFYNDTFQLSPIPDQAYEITMNAYRTPTALALAGDTPELNEWWQLLAYGASMKIFEDKLDMESYQKVQTLFDTNKRLIERRTLKQLSLNRVSTIYTDQYISRTPFNSGT